MTQKLSDWASIAEIVSGIAVVVTLVVLVLGIKDNTDVLRSSMYAQSLESINRFRDSIIENPEAAELWQAFRTGEVADLDDVTLSRVGQMMGRIFTVYDFSYYSWQRGLIGDAEWSRFETQICLQYGRVVQVPRLARDYELVLTDEFREYVASLCAP